MGAKMSRYHDVIELSNRLTSQQDGGKMLTIGVRKTVLLEPSDSSAAGHLVNAVIDAASASPIVWHRFSGGVGFGHELEPDGQMDPPGSTENLALSIIAVH